MKNLLFIFFFTTIPIHAQFYFSGHQPEVIRTSGIKSSEETITYPENFDTLSLQAEILHKYSKEPIYTYYFTYTKMGEVLIHTVVSNGSDTSFRVDQTYTDDRLTMKIEKYPGSNDEYRYEYLYNSYGKLIRDTRIYKNEKEKTRYTYKNDTTLIFVRETNSTDFDYYSCSYRQQGTYKLTGVEHLVSKFSKSHSRFIELTDSLNHMVYYCEKGRSEHKGSYHWSKEKLNKEFFYQTEDNGKLRTVTTKYPGGADTTVYTYDENGNMLSHIEISWANKYIKSKYLKFYRKKGDHRTYHYSRNGINKPVKGKWEFQKVGKTGFDKDSNLVNNDQWVRTVKPVITYKYVYDDHNNWTKKSVYVDGILGIVYERKLAYYN